MVSLKVLWMVLYIIAVAILIFWVFSRIRDVITRVLYIKGGAEARNAVTLLSLIMWIITITIIIGTVVALNRVTLKIPETAIAGIATAVTAGIAFGSQSLFKDIVSGLLFYVEKQARIGDWVDIIIDGGDNISGTVEAVTLRTVTLRTVDHKKVTVPFGAMIYIVNASASEQRTVVDVRFPPDVSLEDIERIINYSLKQLHDKHEDKLIGEPSFVYTTVTEGVNVSIRQQTKQEEKIFIESEIRRLIIKNMEGEKFSLFSTPVLPKMGA